MLLGAHLMKNKYSSFVLDAQINIVPYVDVFLILTVILITSISPLYHQAEVALPRTTTQKSLSHDGKEMPLIVTLDKKGAFHLRNRYINDGDLNQHKLYIKLKAFHQKNPYQKIMLEADKHCSYDRVMELIHIVNQAGFSHIGLVTHPLQPMNQQV
jgi:biopolymer transport protein TolR